MKHLMKVSVIFILLSLTLQSKGQLTFGIKAGLNAGNLNQDFKNSNAEEAMILRIGYHVGATVDLSFSDNLSLQSGMLFTSKGSRVDIADLEEDNETSEGYDRYVLNYLEVPAVITYKILGLRLYAGPYAAIFLGGKNKWDYSYSVDGTVVDEYKGEVKFKSAFGEVSKDDAESLGNDEGYLRALDFGVNFGAGYQVGPILVNAGYSIGLGNLAADWENDPDHADDFKMKNSVISLSLSYLFIK